MVNTLGTNSRPDDCMTRRGVDRPNGQNYQHGSCRSKSRIETAYSIVAIQLSLECRNVLMLLRNDLAMRRETFHLCLHPMQTAPRQVPAFL